MIKDSMGFVTFIRDVVRQELNKKPDPYKIGRVDSVLNGKPAILFDGEQTPSVKRYACLDRYAPAVGDRVLLAYVKGTYIVQDKIRN